MISMKGSGMWLGTLILTGVLGIAACRAAGDCVWTSELENGMTVVMIEDHSAPMVASVICIRAGSRMETPSENGMSHLLEHLLFDGTARSTRAELEHRVTSEGGYFNAFTRKDYVAFEIVMPTEKANLGIRVQAEQLLNSVIPETELEKERKVVCEEIAKDIDDPTGAAEDELMRSLFGESGYGLPVIGNYQTVSEASRESILRFYRSYYTPNRMTAVIIGDFDPSEMLQTVRTEFGVYPRGPERTGNTQKPIWPDEGVSKTITGRVTGEAFLMAFPAPPVSSRDALAFAAAVDLWSGSPASPLQRALTGGEQPLAVEVGTWISDYSGFSLLEIAVTPVKTDGSSEGDPIEDAARRAERIEQTVLASFATWMAEPDLSGIQALAHRWSVDHLFSMEKFHHFARDIVHYEALDARKLILQRAALLEGLTQQSVSESIARIRPATDESGNAGRIEHLSVMVVPGDPVACSADHKTGVPVMTTLKNGLKVIAQSDPGAPIVGMHWLVPIPDGTLPGVSRMTAELLDQGTDKHTSEALAATIEQLGLRIKLADNPSLPFDDYYSSQDYSYFRMESIADSAEPAMRIMAEMALESVFPDDAIRGVKRRLLQISKRSEQSAGPVSRKLLDRMLFPGTVFAESMVPSAESIESITSEQIRDFHRSAYRPSSCLFSISGGLPVSRMIEIAESVWGGYSGGAGPTPPVLTVSSKPGGERVVAEGEQAFVRWAFPLVVKPDQVAPLEVAVTLLSERMQQEIREKMGMAYRLGASVSLKRGVAVIEAAVGTRTGNREDVEKAIERCIREWIKGDVSGETVRATANGLFGEAVRYRMPRVNRAYYASWREFLGFGYDFETRYLDDLRTIDVDSVNRVIRMIDSSPEAWYRVVVDGADSQGAGRNAER